VNGGGASRHRPLIPAPPSVRPHPKPEFSAARDLSGERQPVRL